MQVLDMRLQLPLNELFFPAVNVRVLDRQMGGLHKPMLAYSTIKLQNRLSKTAAEEEASTYRVISPSAEDDIASLSVEAQQRVRAHARWHALAGPFLAAEREKRGTPLQYDFATRARDLERETLGGGGATAASSGAGEGGAAASEPPADDDDEDDSAAHGQGDDELTKEELEDDVKAAKAKLNQQKSPDDVYSAEEQQQALKQLEEARAELDDAIGRLAALSNWKHGRARFDDELEKHLDDLPFENVDLFHGKGKERSKMGTLKVVVRLSEDDDAAGQQEEGAQAAAASDPLLESFKRPSEYVVRVYVLKIGGLTTASGKKPDPYVRVRLGEEKQDTKKATKTDVTRAEIYHVFEFQPARLPGDSTLEVDVLDNNLFGYDEKIGTSELDLEDRVFSPTWNTEHYRKPPIEKRFLYAQGSTNVRGWVTMFVEILTLEESVARPVVDISPPPEQQFELRLVCWEVKGADPELDYSGLADLYSLVYLSQGGADVSKRLRTDTHFRAADHKASWNWRFRLPLTLRHNSKSWRLSLQLWDMDINFNDFAGAAELQLDAWFKKIYSRKVTGPRYWDPSAPNSGFYDGSEDKALAQEHGKFLEKYERAAFGSLKDAGEGLLAGGALAAAAPGNAEADAAKFWVRLSKSVKVDGSNVGTPKYCGHLLVSLQLVPKSMVEQLGAGEGRSEPNANPYLPKPTGRLSFTLNPVLMLYRLLGPKVWRGKPITARMPV